MNSTHLKNRIARRLRILKQNLADAMRPSYVRDEEGNQKEVAPSSFQCDRLRRGIVYRETQLLHIL